MVITQPADLWDVAGLALVVIWWWCWMVAEVASPPANSLP